MTDFNDITPTAGDAANSFEYIFDMCVDPTAEAPEWKNIPDITGLTPTATPKQKDGTTYAHKGQTSQDKTGEDFTLSVQIKGIRQADGEFQDYLVDLIKAADSKGQANIVGLRYYDAYSKVLAYQLTASVNWSRANTGNDDLEFFSFEFTGKGDRVRIESPAAGGEVEPTDPEEN